VFIDQSEAGVVEITVVKHGLSSGAGRKYPTIQEAKAVLLVFGFDSGLVDRQFAALSEMSPHVLVRFPVTDIVDDFFTIVRIHGHYIPGCLDEGPQRSAALFPRAGVFHRKPTPPSDCDEQGIFSSEYHALSS
jgi:hypothetical protein